MTKQKQFGILGVRIDNINKNELEQKLTDFLNSTEYNWIATINPEILVYAHNQPLYICNLNQSNLNLIDGAGLQYVSWLKFFGQTQIYRYPGVDLIDVIVKSAWEKKLKILFFGSREKINNQATAQIAAKFFQKKYHNIKIDIEQGGEIELENNKIKFNHGLITKLQNINPDVMIIALNNPRQEFFIQQLKQYLPQTKLSIGIGGGFNMIAGLLPRAPKIMRQLGLEWLWRLILEPKRIKRIWQAVIIFPTLVIGRVFFKHYRRNVSIAVINNKGEFLLCERSDGDQHWQFPQGGIEQNMTAIDMVYKELEEEVGINTKQIAQLYQCPQINKYTWSKEYLNKNFRNGYNGQKQNIFIAKFIGHNDDIVIDHKEFKNYKWVSLDNIEQEIHQVRLKGLHIVLKNLKNINI